MLCILFLAAFFLDRKFMTNLKRYFVVVILQIIIIWPVAEPVQNWQIEIAIEKSEEIIFAIYSYKKQCSVYPHNLFVLNENRSAKISFKTGFGTEFEYKLIDSNEYTLNFISYKGNTAYYNQDLKEWVFRD